MSYQNPTLQKERDVKTTYKLLDKRYQSKCLIKIRHFRKSGKERQRESGRERVERER